MAVAHTTAVGLVGANLFITINRIILGSFSNIAIGIGTCYFLAPAGPVHGAIRLTQRNNHANISELLDNLLRGYDNSIRPDFGGKWTSRGNTNKCCGEEERGGEGWIFGADKRKLPTKDLAEMLSKC